MALALRQIFGSTPVRLLVAAGIALLLAFLAYPGLDGQIRRLRHAEIRDAVVSVATRADHGMAQHRAYPATIAGPGLSNVTFSYVTDAAQRDYAVTAYNSKWQVWAGANGRKLRCTCTDCMPHSLSGNAQSCPEGTQAY